EGVITHPRMIREVLKEISVIKNISVDQVAETIYENTIRLYPAICRGLRP
ncbi:TatD family deoxyribonuclease, partial [Bacillus cereus]|nr:TatD family deoxyribonuclease [Bacillus cereus]